MYEIKRSDGKVIVMKGSVSKLNAPDDSWVIYQDASGTKRASKLKELTDEQLLLALADAIEIPGATDERGRR